MKVLSLIVFFALTGITAAGVPRDLASHLGSDRLQKVFPTRESMPPQLKNVLKRTFKQQRLALANPKESIRETTFIVGDVKNVPPTRRLITAFETAKYFIVYYQVAGYQSGATVLAFRKEPKVTLVWGGVSFTYNPSATPSWVAQQIARHKFLDDYPFIW